MQKKNIFYDVVKSNGSLKQTIEQAKQSHVIIPESYIQNYLNPEDNVDIISMRKNIIKKLKEFQTEQKQNINFLDAFELSRSLKNKGYNTKYQAVALIYKLIKDNNLPYDLFSDEQNKEIQIAVEDLFAQTSTEKNEANSKSDYADIIQKEEEIQKEEKIKEEIKQEEDRQL